MKLTHYRTNVRFFKLKGAMHLNNIVYRDEMPMGAVVQLSDGTLLVGTGLNDVQGVEECERLLPEERE